MSFPAAANLYARAFHPHDPAGCRYATSEKPQQKHMPPYCPSPLIVQLRSRESSRAIPCAPLHFSQRTGGHRFSRRPAAGHADDPGHEEAHEEAGEEKSEADDGPAEGDDTEDDAPPEGEAGGGGSLPAQGWGGESLEAAKSSGNRQSQEAAQR